MSRDPYLPPYTRTKAHYLINTGHPGDILAAHEWLDDQDAKEAGFTGGDDPAWEAYKQQRRRGNR